MFHRRHDPPRPGVMVVWLVLALVTIISVVALALDGGRMLAERQHVQATADASALAAAGILYQQYTTDNGLDLQGNAQAAALQMATANGITNGTNAVITVNIPPSSGDFQSMPGYAEVIIAEQMSPAFSRIFGANALTIRARAVARGIKKGQVNGVYVLQSTGGGTFHINDQTAVTVNGPVYVNSNGGSALQIDGKGTLTAESISVTGTWNTPAGSVTTTNPPGTSPKTGPPVSDPLGALPVPSTVGVPVQSTNTLNVKTTMTIDPGIYVGGIKVTNPGNLTMNPGVYIIQGGGFTIGGSPTTVTGTGVMIYNTGTGANGAGTGAINFDPKCDVSLSPPTSGPYTGISIFQDRASNQNMTIQFNNNKNIAGAIYAPAAPIKFQGQALGTTDFLGSSVIGLTFNVEHGSCTIGSTNTLPPVSLYGLVD
jgi:hypothetical protein